MSMQPPQHYPYGQPVGPPVPGQPKPFYKKKRYVIPAGVLAGLVVIAAVSPASEKKDEVATVAPSVEVPADPATAKKAAADPATAKKAAAKKAAADKLAAKQAAKTAAADAAAAEKAETDENGPAQQREFVAAVEAGRTAFEDADNELVERRAQKARDEAVCAVVPTRKATGWVGEIKNLDTNGGGNAVLELEIGDDTKVSTWNNDMSDFSDKTLIPMDSPIYDTLIAMAEGDRIRFSGAFVRDSKTCLGEQSMTLNGQMKTPTFTFRFSKVSVI